ncbi:unnamed protein product [Urochloa humidicola]
MDRVAATPIECSISKSSPATFESAWSSRACDAAQPMAPRQAWRLRLRHDAPAGRWLRSLRKHDIPAGGRGAAAVRGLGLAGDSGRARRPGGAAARPPLKPVAAMSFLP